MKTVKTGLEKWMNEPAHEEIRTDDYRFRDEAVVFDEPHSRTVDYSPFAEVALKCANNIKRNCHQHSANEQHRTSAPFVNV
jgi:hypothetical protein